MINKEQQILNSLMKLSIPKLVELFLETEKDPIMNHWPPEIFKVRGWLMDVLEARDPEGFEHWIEWGESIREAFHVA